MAFAIFTLIIYYYSCYLLLSNILNKIKHRYPRGRLHGNSAWMPSTPLSTATSWFSFSFSFFCSLIFLCFFSSHGCHLRPFLPQLHGFVFFWIFPLLLFGRQRASLPNLVDLFFLFFGIAFLLLIFLPTRLPSPP